MAEANNNLDDADLRHSCDNETLSDVIGEIHTNCDVGKNADKLNLGGGAGSSSESTIDNSNNNKLSSLTLDATIITDPVVANDDAGSSSHGQPPSTTPAKNTILNKILNEKKLVTVMSCISSDLL